MNDNAKTLIAVLIAAGLASAAWLTAPKPRAAAQFSDVGQLLSPSLTDPLAAKSLEIISFDQNTASFSAFKVEFNGKQWVIPSHYSYPADAETKMAQAASAFVGLHKESVVSDSPADHAALGVLAPDDDTAPLEGRGTRVVIRDTNGAVLSEIILGRDVPDEPNAQAPSNKRYVRLAGSNRVYTTTLTGSVSTRFTDWIETDPLRAATGADILEVASNRYRIDDKTGSTTDHQRVELTRPMTDAGVPGVWALNAEPGGPPGPDQEINPARADRLLNALNSIKIVGVRPKPANLANILAGTAAPGANINAADMLSLQSRGFYLTERNSLVSSQGTLSVGRSDGVRYTLMFGEVAPGAGLELSAGLDAPDKQPDAAPESATHRYLFVTAAFDESLLPPAPTPPTPPAASTPTEPAPEGSAENEDKPAEDAEYAAAKAAYDSTLAEREEKIKQGKKAADDLAKRFSPWYYVIDASSFDALRPTRDELLTLKSSNAPGVPQPTPVMPVPPGE
ncbi:MAG: DUF4340 domain-containing protein [Phycisphaerales bacterium]